MQDNNNYDEQLLSIAEMCKMLGISETRLRHYRGLGGFPKPVIRSQGIPGGKTPNLYSYPEVLKFYLANKDSRVARANKIQKEFKAANDFNARASSFMRSKLI